MCWMCAGNTGIVDCHFCLRRQLGACPHSISETRERWSCLRNHHVDLYVQGEVVSDGGAEEGELTDSIKFVVVDVNCVSMMFVVFRLVVRPKSLQACLQEQSNNDWSSSCVWDATSVSPALTGTVRTFVLALNRAKLKSLSSDRVRRYIPSVVVSKECFSSRAKTIPESVVARMQPSFTPLRISNGSEVLTFNCQCGRTRSCSVVSMGTRYLGEP